MSKTTNPPLSPTVKCVFDEFLKALEEEKLLSTAIREALAENLYNQRIDHDTLRKAIFETSEPSE